MKKALSLLMTIILILGLLPGALAYDEEITFQGIPWGASLNEVSNTLLESGLIDEPLKGVDAEGKEPLQSFAKKIAYFVPNYETLPDEFLLDYLEKDNLSDSAGSISTAVLKTIGGLEVKSVFFSLFDDVQSNSYQLFLVVIQFAKFITAKKFEYESGSDLLNQLISKYGKPQQVKRRISGFNYLINIWMGANDTELVYILGDGREQYAHYLFYGNKAMSDRIRQLVEVVVTPEPAKEDAGI